MNHNADGQPRDRKGRFGETSKPAVSAPTDDAGNATTTPDHPAVVHPRSGQTLITESQMAALVKQGEEIASDPEADWNHKPVLKLFGGAGTWLISSVDPQDHDHMFALCDLGVGCPELGSVSCSELQRLDCGFGLGVERDIYWEPKATLSEYAAAARDAGMIQA